MTPKEKALLIARSTAEKNGIEVCVLDLQEVASFTDFFVIVEGTSGRHARTVADAAVEAVRAEDEKPLSVEGERSDRWILVDFGDVVLHVFSHEAREFYSLERLWGDAESVELPSVAGGVG